MAGLNGESTELARTAPVAAVARNTCCCAMMWYHIIAQQHVFLVHGEVIAAIEKARSLAANPNVCTHMQEGL